MTELQDWMSFSVEFRRLSFKSYACLLLPLGYCEIGGCSPLARYFLELCTVRFWYPRQPAIVRRHFVLENDIGKFSRRALSVLDLNLNFKDGVTGPHDPGAHSGRFS